MTRLERVKLAVVGTGVSSVSSMVVSTIDATVSNSSVARDTSVAVVNTSDDSNVVGMSSSVGVVLGKTVGNLAEGVSISLGLRISVGGNNGHENNGKGLHLCCIQ